MNASDQAVSDGAIRDSAIRDLDIREQSLDISRSFAVSAPAGSGKTGLLIRRILKLLAVCQQPEQVLAITFTRKAAAEMHERVMAALTGAAHQPQPASDYERAIWHDATAALQQDAAQGWNLLANAARLRIMTIDSLSRHLARQLAIETGLGELPEPAEQPDTLYREAVSQLFAELESPGPVADDLALLLGHMDNNLANLETLLIQLLAQREQWLTPLLQAGNTEHARTVLQDTLQQVVSDCLSALHKLLLPVAGELTDLAGYAAANLKASHSEHPLTLLAGITALPAANADQEAVTRWQALGQLLVTNGEPASWRKAKGLNKSLGFPTKKDSILPEQADEYKARLVSLLDWCSHQQGLLALVDDLRNLPSVNYSDAQWQLLGALTRLLPRLAALLNLVFDEQRSSDFSQITLAAHQALGAEDDPSQLAMKLDYQIRHILVDEFQDTSFLQFSLLKKLIAGWQPGDGRSLFIVGDGMQSLYGFRNANVGLFLQARQEPVNQIRLQPLDLCANFRSEPAIVDWVNSTFASVFPARQDISRGAVPYAPAQAARPDSGEGRVTIDAFAHPASPQEEARQVVHHVLAARQADANGSIAILTRARSHLPAILHALHEAGIAWQATDIDPLATRMPVVDLLSLTRALLNPADRIAWLAVLRAPWCGLDLHDLHSLANDTDPADPEDKPDFPWLPARMASPEVIARLSPDGQQALARTATALKAAMDNRLRKPLRQWIEGTWLALGGPATLLNSDELAWSQQYFTLLEQHDSAGQLADMAVFEQAVTKLYAASQPKIGDNPVQIMTIHKSKGLEFDTVIMPGLHRSGSNRNSNLLYWRERIAANGEEQLLIAPPLSPREQNNSASDSLLVKHLKYEAKCKSTLEDARVLYVGCTRAIKRLHLLFTDKGKAPNTGSLLACLWPALGENLAATGASVTLHPAMGTSPASAEDDDDSGIPATAQTQLLRLGPQWRNPAQQYLSDKAAATQESDKPYPANGQAIPREQTESRHLGTVLHRTLRQIVLDGVDHWDEQRLKRQQRSWHLQLQALDVQDTTPLISRLHNAIQTMLEDTTGRWLLDHRHPQSACEIAVGHVDDNGNPTVSVIDRLFVDNGTLWIVDYKSSQPVDGESLATFLQREKASYAPQLQRYRTAVGAQHLGTIKTALYFPLIAHLEVVD